MLTRSSAVCRRGGRTAAVALAAALFAAAPAHAAHNLIVNGSFETGDFADFNHIGTAGLAFPAVVIDYGNAGAYGMGGASGEAVPVDDAVSRDTDPPETHAAYFVDGLARGEALTQATQMHVGNYEIGFDVYLPANGARNPDDATLDGSIIGVDVAHLTASQAGASHWYNISGVASITQPGWYLTAFTYTASGPAAKAFVVDKVYVQATTRAATYAIPPTPMAALPEPEAWTLMLAGFVFTGTFLRRRDPAAVAA